MSENRQRRYALPAYMGDGTRELLAEMAQQDGETASSFLRSLVRQEAVRRGIPPRRHGESAREAAAQ